MIDTEWHVDPADLANYAAGEAGPAQLASVEAHLGTCARCRAALTDQLRAAAGGEARDDAVWAGIADRVDRGNWALRRWPRLATVSLSSPPLMTATALIAAALVALVVGARLGSPRYATTVLVSLGPISPLVAAHLAFGPRVDPAGRMAAAAPFAAGRIAALRALAATLIACAVGAALTPLTTIPAADLVVWLLPALAGTAIAVAVSTYVDATVPSIAMAIAWLGGVAVWLAGAPQAVRGATLDGLASNRAEVQIALAIATVVAAAIALVRTDADPAWRRAA